MQEKTQQPEEQKQGVHWRRENHREIWLLFTRAREVKESGGQRAAAVWKAERRWACSGFVASCPGSRFLHLPLGQKLKKSPVTYPRTMLLVFTPVCCPNLLRV